MEKKTKKPEISIDKKPRAKRRTRAEIDLAFQEKQKIDRLEQAEKDPREDDKKFLVFKFPIKRGTADPKKIQAAVEAFVDAIHNDKFFKYDPNTNTTITNDVDLSGVLEKRTHIKDRPPGFSFNPEGMWVKKGEISTVEEVLKFLKVERKEFFDKIKKLEEENIVLKKNSLSFVSQMRSLVETQVPIFGYLEEEHLEDVKTFAKEVAELHRAYHEKDEGPSIFPHNGHVYRSNLKEIYWFPHNKEVRLLELIDAVPETDLQVATQLIDPSMYT